jgi:2-succinyl-6-hydroxy-2,4-cyclohexadiene-1-carboxylate synthase
VQAPLVVFVPGFMQRGEAWAPIAGRVAERYPTVCIDFETHTLAGRLDELRAAAPAGAAAVGYSMGGRLALQLATREPERFTALVLVGASAGIEDPGERERRRAADLELAAWIESAPIEDVVARWEAQPVFASQPPELVEAQRPGRLSHDPADLAKLLRSAGQGAFEPAWDRIASLPVPLLAIAGECDERYAAAARRLAELAPRGRAELIPGAGHAAHLERPDEVARLVLDATASGTAAP